MRPDAASQKREGELLSCQEGFLRKKEKNPLKQRNKEGYKSPKKKKKRGGFSNKKTFPPATRLCFFPVCLEAGSFFRGGYSLKMKCIYFFAIKREGGVGEVKSNFEQQR